MYIKIKLHCKNPITTNTGHISLANNKMHIALTANTGMLLNEDEQEFCIFTVSYCRNLSFWYVMRIKMFHSNSQKSDFLKFVS